MIVFDNSIYASGRGLPGKSGPTGDAGQNANCIFYVPVDLQTSNNVKFVLEKIQKNVRLDSDSESKLPVSRPYQSDDMFYSCAGKLYKLNDTSTGFIEIGIIDSEYIPDLSITVAAGKLTVACANANRGYQHYNYQVYYEDDHTRYPLTGIITDASSGKNIVYSGSILNVLVKCINTDTGKTEFLKVEELPTA